eukprot:GHVH01012093.1.p1 GENE.GHVH01012093.1~~GHVH01012093.1.p1  ORF type:complete len:161 (+),score=20.71 GHVH01012093.1:35-517(+)
MDDPLLVVCESLAPPSPCRSPTMDTVTPTPTEDAAKVPPGLEEIADEPIRSIKVNPSHLGANLKHFHYYRTILSAVSGTTAGLLGSEGLLVNIVVYLLVQLIGCYVLANIVHNAYVTSDPSGGVLSVLGNKNAVYKKNLLTELLTFFMTWFVAFNAAHSF